MVLGYWGWWMDVKGKIGKMKKNRGVEIRFIGWECWWSVYVMLYYNGLCGTLLIGGS
jgi:hypothetical protein